MKFEELDLNDNILDALYAMHFDECTPVQEKCIPEILSGKDVLGVAQTGTGKTAAYLLPILSRLDDGGYPKDAVNCVIMSPTRELAQQIDQAMQGFGYYLQGVSSVAVYGGNDGNRYDQELKSMRLGADVIIATPGRLISHLQLGNLDLSKVSFFVLDEADRMLDMGFSEDIMTIAKYLPKSCQTVMFSATMPSKIEELAKTLLKNPSMVKLAVSKPAEKIQQSAYLCYEPQKLGIIRHLFKENDLKRVIVFCGKKTKVKEVNRQLVKMKINSGEMHSDLTQSERDDMMFRFKSGQLDVLVATDIVARGIDIDDIAMVINYDVPRDAEDYVHRIGRTARADKDGVAITFVSAEDMSYFKDIERFLGKEIKKNELPQDLGEQPSYNRGGQKAKARRRNDRNQTAHKRKPTSASRQETRQEPLETAEKTAQGKNDGGQKNSANRRRRNPGQPQGQSGSRNRQSRGESSASEGQQNKRPNDNQRPPQNRKRVNRQRHNNRNVQKQQAEAVARQQAQTAQPQKKSITGLVKKAFGWLHRK
ncbi:DEAD/DEAH box helicase [Prevotella sp. oral taxon 376]|uniref:DEAD/DEAH box helicase n=1 Tax=Prevotella sp. oral taxon 376 TaxID=712466 RepID=UPI000D1D8D8A|nr:DEAD/DEAH box helicase [Prevotella sp. oral taxon 376]PTL33037.1 DEAD/DEAH box helicase [Prevotella sp. oral taxon 376]